MLDEGFSTKRGEMFGFGPHSERDSEPFLKISRATPKKKLKHNSKEKIV
jgi:hypothetical protein